MTELLLQPGARILFQGDSITDAGRSRENDAVLGGGYANLVACWLSARYPERNFTFLNRGISGNRVYDLEARWTDDCIALEPDWVSLLIGINDTWRRFDRDMLSPIPEFEESLRRILERVKMETAARVMLLEPFLLHTKPGFDAWREDLNPRIDAVRRAARDYAAIYVPLDGLFAAASVQQPPAYWAGDGVHPTQAGHALIAQAWVGAVQGR